MKFETWRRRIFKRHPYALHIVVPALFLGLVLVVSAQMLYPYDQTLPRTTIGGVLVESKNITQAIETLHQHYDGRKIEVKLPDRPSIMATTIEAGVIPEYLPAVQKAQEYSFTDRLIPFSFVYRLWHNEYPLEQKLDAELSSQFIDHIQSHCTIAAADAQLEFKQGEAQLVKATDGQTCDKKQITDALTHIELTQTKLLATVETTKVPPARTDKQMQTLMDEATATMRAGLTLASTTDQWVIPPEQMADWLVVGGAKEDPTLDVDINKIKAFVETLRGKLYVEPGQSVTQYIDGRVTSSSTGANGMGVDADVTAARVADALLGRTADRKIWVKLAVLPPKQIDGRQYTPTPQGLRALIDQWDRENSGVFGVMVIDLTGKGMNAELNPDKDFITASTFKMFVAYATMHKIEQGAISFDTVTDNGFTVRGCINEMILHSTNPCAISLMNLINWGWAHAFIKAQFPATSIDNGASGDGEKHSTVRDETAFMQRLAAGQLMNSDNSNYLLGLFQRQIWRSGIPRGVPGITVADKVGFYAGYVHDVGIIYAPRGPYILGIMSRGGANPQFADLSRKVYELMKQN